TGRAIADGAPSGWNLRAAGRSPAPSGRRLVKRRKTEQAHICLGTNGLARTDPERFAFLIANTALGGGMSSRLFPEIREHRGRPGAPADRGRDARRCARRCRTSTVAADDPHRARAVWLGSVQRGEGLTWSASV